MAFIGGGFWVQQLVVGWLVYDITRSPLLTSLALGLDALPSLVAGPIGGLLADVWDRRKFLVVSSAYQAIVTGVFGVVMILGRIEAWHIFAYVLAMGISWAIADPARFALVANIVPKNGLLNAFALNGLAFNGSRLVAPAAAGLLIVWVGPGPTLLLGAAMHVGAGFASAAMRVRSSDHSGRRIEKPLQRIREGVRYVRRERLVLVLTILTATTMLLFVPFVHGLMPVYASEVYGVGPAGLGLLMSVVGIGSIIGTVLVASVGDIRNKGGAIVAALALTIVAVVAFSRIPAMSPAILALMLLSGGFTAFLTISSATIQSVVPDELRGRVSSIGTMTIGLFPLGSLAAGGLAELFGAPSATLLAGIALAIVSTGVLLRFRGVLTPAQG